MKARVVGISTARQMVFFSLSSHLDVNVMSICLVSQILVEHDIVVRSSIFLLVIEIPVSRMGTGVDGAFRNSEVNY